MVKGSVVRKLWLLSLGSNICWLKLAETLYMTDSASLLTISLQKSQILDFTRFISKSILKSMVRLTHLSCIALSPWKSCAHQPTLRIHMTTILILTFNRRLVSDLLYQLYLISPKVAIIWLGKYFLERMGKTFNNKCQTFLNLIKEDWQSSLTSMTLNKCKKCCNSESNSISKV